MASVQPKPEDEPFTSRQLRDALGLFATGVTVVTARDEAGEPVGMTASSFNSVSLDPPLVLWSVGNAALSAPAFKAARRFAIHVLSSRQSALSNRFARSGSDKFGGLEWSEDGDGVPLLPGVAARFDCVTHALHEGGDHTIVVGRVIGLGAANLEPLVFAGGGYATAVPLRAPMEVVADAGAGAGVAGGGLEDLLFYRLSRAYHELAGSVHEAVREAGLTLGEWRVLASLSGGARVDRATLARRTFQDPESLSDTLAGLAEAGLCAVDGTQVRGLPEGDRRVARIFAQARRLEDALTGTMDRHERAGLEELLGKLLAATDGER